MKMKFILLCLLVSSCGSLMDALNRNQKHATENIHGILKNPSNLITPKCETKDGVEKCEEKKK